VAVHLLQVAVGKATRSNSKLACTASRIEPKYRNVDDPPPLRFMVRCSQSRILSTNQKPLHDAASTLFVLRSPVGIVA
jgi:hypothetical protein